MGRIGGFYKAAATWRPPRSVAVCIGRYACVAADTVRWPINPNQRGGLGRHGRYIGRYATQRPIFSSMITDERKYKGSVKLFQQIFFQFLQHIFLHFYIECLYQYTYETSIKRQTETCGKLGSFPWSILALFYNLFQP